MQFTPLNKVQQLWLKMKSTKAYKDYKFLHKLQGVQHPEISALSPTDVYFKHSGNAGDIIYSLPAIYALSKGRNIHLYLHINQEAKHRLEHPLGNVMLNEKMVSLLHPLLLYQPQFKTCTLYTGQPIDVDLDAFRNYPFNYSMGHIARWYFLAFGINADLGKPWLQASPDASVKEAIVIARSKRYRAPGIHYQFLNQYPHIVFLGLKDEYEDMKKAIPHLIYRPVADFFEMACVIAGSKLFIGNQSFPFSLAEALKVTRLLEVYHQTPNVIVEGASGYDFCYQPQFEKLVAQLYRP